MAQLCAIIFFFLSKSYFVKPKLKYSQYRIESYPQFKYFVFPLYSGSWSGSDTTSLRVSYQIPLSTLTVKLPPTTHLNTADSEMATELHLTSPIRYVYVCCTIPLIQINTIMSLFKNKRSMLDKIVQQNDFKFAICME